MDPIPTLLTGPALRTDTSQALGTPAIIMLLNVHSSKVTPNNVMPDPESRAWLNPHQGFAWQWQLTQRPTTDQHAGESL